MMPLLCLYADCRRHHRRGRVGVGMLDLSWTPYIGQTTHAVRLGDIVGRRLQERRVRRLDRARRLPARHAVPAAARRPSGGSHLRRRDQHRRSSSWPAACSPCFQRPGDLMADESAAGNGADALHHRARSRPWRTAASSLMRDMNFTVKPRRCLHHHGRQRLRQEHPAAAPDRPQPAGARQIFYEGQDFTTADPSSANGFCSDASACCFRAARCGAAMTLAENIGLLLEEYTDLNAGRDPRARRAQARARRASKASRTTTRRRSAAACRSAPDWLAPWRWIRTSCSSTSRRPASTRSARAGWTS